MRRAAVRHPRQARAVASARVRLVPGDRRLREAPLRPDERRTGRGVAPLSEPAIPARTPTDATTAPPSPNASGAKEAAPTYSTTNVQEEGVDEPDVVKTDGVTIFTVVGDTLYAVAATGAGAPRIVGSLSPRPLRRRPAAARQAPAGDPDREPRSRPSRWAAAAARGSPRSRAQAQTVLTEVDVADPAALKVARTLTLDGQYVNARQNGAHRARRGLLDAARLRGAPTCAAAASGWLPRSRFASQDLRRAIARAVVACHAVRRPPTFSGLGMLSVLTIDLDKGLPAVDSDAVMTDAQTVYGSADQPLRRDPALDRPRDAGRRTCRRTTSRTIHRFDVSDPDRTTYAASGDGPGLPAQPVLALRVRGRSCASPRPRSRPGWTQGSASRAQTAELRDRAAAGRAQRSRPSGASAASARASASTRCASSATPATS